MRRLSAIILAVWVLCSVFLISCSQQTPASLSSSSEGFSIDEDKSLEKVVDLKDPIWILLIGNDTRYGIRDDVKEEDPAFSDTIMLMRVDPEGNYVSILSLPRDTKTDFDGKPGKLNEAYYWGKAGWLIEKVQDLTDVEIDYYFDTSFVNFSNMIDEIGGITVDIPAHIEWPNEIGDDLVVLPEGEDQTLDGVKALTYVRMRKHYVDNGEACRQYNARQVIASGLRKVASSSPEWRDSCVSMLEAGCDTNMDAETLNAYLEKFAVHGDNLLITTGSGPYAGEADSESGLWLAPADPETYNALINAMETRGDLYEIVPAPSFETAY